MKLLIVEDEKDLRESIWDFCKKEGFVCEQAWDFATARAKLSLYAYDLVLLDITLPGGSGLDLLADLKKKHPKTGILILSAKDSLDDRIHGLETGADDYLSKPFHLSELNARIHAILRRRSFDGQSQVAFNELSLDPRARKVQVHDSPIELTRKEFDLLLYLITNKSRVLTKEAIAEHLWGDHIDTADNFDFVYTHVKNLRKKIIGAGGQDYLKTVYGVGYKFEVS